MTSTVPAPDRRAALKARHRAAILDAARALVAERGGPQFGVDELAARADVARRTVFNHFPSLDAVVLSVCEEALSDIVDEFLADVARTPVGDGSRASMFDEIAGAMHAADLPSAIATIFRTLGGPPLTDDGTENALTDAAFARLGDRLLQEVARRHPGADPLDAELLVGSLMTGLVVIAKHWIRTTDARLDDTGRASWSLLLTRLVDGARSGYMPT